MRKGAILRPSFGWFDTVSWSTNTRRECCTYSLSAMAPQGAVNLPASSPPSSRLITKPWPSTGVTRRGSLLATPKPLLQPAGARAWRRWAHQSGSARPTLEQQLTPPTGGQAPAPTRRRQVLLAGVAPVCCCAACGQRRNGFMDRLFATAMAETMGEYEAAIAPLKRLLFGQLAQGLGPLERPARVLEIGIGSGPNLGYYPGGSAAFEITGVDPNPYMLPYLRSNAAALGWPEGQLQWVEGVAEELPLHDASVDAVVCTLVLCSVPSVPAVLQQVRRVLRPGGQFLFIEHTIAQQGRPFLQLQQRVLDPLQQALADGCHLTRDPLPSIQAAGFASVDAKRFEVDGMGLIGPHVAGIATA